MKYIVFITTNVKSKIQGINRIYCGIHKTENPEVFDGYIGDGVWINKTCTFMYPKTPFQYAVKKYGTDSFKREILYIFDDEPSALLKEQEIVDVNFVKQDFVYNVYPAITSEPIYQFDLNKNLVKTWNSLREACYFYSSSETLFRSAIRNKHILQDSYWNNIPSFSESNKRPRIYYIYSINGKLVMEFTSEKECANFLGIDNIQKAILNQTLIGNYYVSDSLTDEFIPKARKQYYKADFYVYDSDNKFYGKFTGKKVMPVINLHSWTTIKNVITNKGGWYKDFYLSLERIDKVPERNQKKVKVFDKYGNFIEELNSLKKVKDKYKVPSAKLKDIERGNRYFENWIFEYSK